MQHRHAYLYVNELPKHPLIGLVIVTDSIIKVPNAALTKLRHTCTIIDFSLVLHSFGLTKFKHNGDSNSAMSRSKLSKVLQIVIVLQFSLHFKSVSKHPKDEIQPTSSNPTSMTLRSSPLLRYCRSSSMNVSTVVSTLTFEWLKSVSARS